MDRTIRYELLTGRCLRGRFGTVRIEQRAKTRSSVIVAFPLLNLSDFRGQGRRHWRGNWSRCSTFPTRGSPSSASNRSFDAPWTGNRASMEIPTAVRGPKNFPPGGTASRFKLPMGVVDEPSAFAQTAVTFLDCDPAVGRLGSAATLVTEFAQALFRLYRMWRPGS